METGERLINSPVCVVGEDGMGGASARRIMKMMQGPDDAMPASKVKFQINPRHPIIHGLHKLIEKDEPLPFWLPINFWTTPWPPQTSLMTRGK